MKIVHLDRIKKKKVEMEGAVKVFKQVPLSALDGAPNYALRVFTIEPGGNTPYHIHDYEHMNYIIDGEGAVVNEEGKKQPVKKGDFVLVMPNEKHQYLNLSDVNEMVMICGVPVEHE